MPLPMHFQQLKVRGHFLPQTLLLDNQHYQHKFGYNVLSPLLLDNGDVILVDRGWVENDRKNLPTISVFEGVRDVLGSVYYPSNKNWLLGVAIEIKHANLAVIEIIDTKLIAKFLHKTVYPFTLRLDSRVIDDYVRKWAIVAMSPERHYAYAFQWFAIAMTIFILFIVLNLSKKYEN